MDKSQHNKLSQIFEQAAEQEAQANPLPEQLWQKIAQDLSASTEATNSIQQAFEEQELPELPPIDLWGNIAQGLNDNKIKQSFEEEASPVVPTAVWNDIEQQLEIETVWKKIHKALDRRSSWLYWREKAVQGSLILLLLLWWKGCEQGEQPQPPIASTPVAIVEKSVVTNKNKATEIEQVVSTTVAPNPSNKDALPSNISKENKEEALAPSLDDTNYKKDKQAIALTPTVQQGKQEPSAPSIPQGLKSSQTGKENSPQATGQRSQWYDLPMAKQEEEEQKQNNSAKEIPSSILRTNLLELEKNTNITTTEEVVADNNKRANSSKANTTSSHHNVLDLTTEKPTPSLQYWLLGTHTVPTLTTPEKVNNPSLIALEEVELEGIKEPKFKHKIRVEFGMQARLKGTMLLGNMTTEAMESSSMIKTKVLPTAAVGANLLGYFTKNDAFFVALHPMANSRQYFGGFTEEGRYYHKEIKLSYFDAELGYHRTLFHYNDFGALPSTVYARVSYGFGYLNKGETILNGMLVDETQQYHKINHSLGLALGNTHRLRNWIIDYGIYGQVGLSTIHLQDPTAYRHLLGVGAHVGLRYVL